MSNETKRVYDARSKYPDRGKLTENSFSPLSVVIKNLETSLLLLGSKEEPVLQVVLSHLSEFARKQDENVLELKQQLLLESLVDKELFIDAESVIIRRFALFLITAILDNTELGEYDTEKTTTLLDVAFRFYLKENDEFCIEYLTYIVNLCLRDPKVAQSIIENIEFLEKFKNIFISSDNPDTVFNSIEALHKILQVQSAEEMLEFTTLPGFPVDRIVCELTNDFLEIRLAAIKVLKTLLADTSDESVFEPLHRCFFVLQQLVKAFCLDPKAPDALGIIEVLATALRSEKMTKLFFEQNLFDQMVENLKEIMDTLPPEVVCAIISIFAEAAKYQKYLPRIHKANITDMFIKCLMKSKQEPAPFVIMGIIRLIAHPEALRAFVAEYENGALSRLISLFRAPDVSIKTREQAAELIGSLLVNAFRVTAEQLMELNIAESLVITLKQGLSELSIDLILSLLSIIESLADNDEYRTTIGENTELTEQIAQLLMRSYAHSILVHNIFRCLCTIIDEQPVREVLLENYIISSMKRALKSLSNLVKTAVTNFILQTTRFNEFVDAYIDRGILEVLMLFQKHAFCVSTWGPAIESILSKCPTMKFCIRNYLGFTDITAGKDFYVSKRKFEDFRCFQNILRHDCSPLEAVLVVNFDRPTALAEDVVCVPTHCLHDVDNAGDQNWEYCKRPADDKLPVYLEALNETLALNGLVENPDKIRRSIDFENVAKRSKIIAEAVNSVMGEDIKILDINTTEECSRHTVRCHLEHLRHTLHTNFIPIGAVHSGCQFERAILFKCFADQIGLPCTLQRSVDGRMLYNEVPLPLEVDKDIHCDQKTLKFMPWRMLRPTHIVDLMYNIGELYPMQSRQALQYLRLY
ncbi:hypothetical protein AWZ03_009174 [Drosophila navojoa]|uniref:EDR1/CTR1/ARMC3-like peptidase-like domain-containing protein n=1 Tax=Drosophila navojoa TaxID=7232 RepID=A0A484B961_DRONA|nr:uncharacterized protein LOC108653666 [Drosophila navojoa]TDG44371.1 hypothetical protein AWZ03_009174 [Drosophila navojoa]